jgi:5'-nucleotidase
MKFPGTILITNDDGINAPGIRALQEVVEGLGGDCILVAPSDVQSGCSHLTSMHVPVTVDRLSEKEVAVNGTPADCVRLCLHTFCPEVKLVLSGINAGGNLGHDIYLSGTLAAAREAAFHRIPAIAFSQYISPDRDLDWPLSARLCEVVLEDLLSRPWEDGIYWNVNLPRYRSGDPDPAMKFVEPCRASLPIDYRVDEAGFHYQRGLYHSRKAIPGTDVAACFGGDIAVSRLSL